MTEFSILSGFLVLVFSTYTLRTTNLSLSKPKTEGTSDGLTFPKLLVCLNSMHSLAKIQIPVFGANVTASTIYEYYGQFIKFGGYNKDDWDQFLLNHTIKDKIDEIDADYFTNFDSVEFLNQTGPSYYIMR